MPGNLLCAWIGLAAWLVATPCSATTIRLGPLTGQYQNWGLSSGVGTMCLFTPTQYNPASPMYGWLEYPLDGIPDEAGVISASIEIRVTAVEQWNRVRFSAYPANGKMDRSDVLLAHNPYDLGSGPAMDVPRSYSKSIDPAYVQTLLATSTHLGVILASSRYVSPIWIDSPLGVSPVLTVTYIPEPSSLLLLVCGTVLASVRQLTRAT